MRKELIAAAVVLIIIYLAFSLKEGFQGNVNVVPEPVLSYYRSMDQGANKMLSAERSDKVIVGLHYTNWCSYCKQMKPVWQEVKASLNNPNFSSVVMIENDEEAKPTPGVSMYPTIIRYEGGKARRYKGRYDVDELRTFILTPFTVTTYGSMLPS